MRIEAGQLDQAMDLAADWPWTASSTASTRGRWSAPHRQATVIALSITGTGCGRPCCVADPDRDRDGLRGCLACSRGEALITFYDGFWRGCSSLRANLRGARDRDEMALELAEETGMHYYAAELLRFRARTP